MKLTLEETLQEIETYIFRRFAGLENLDDMVQEARISAWKDYLDGKEQKHICVRAKYRVMGLMKAGTPTAMAEGGAHPQQWTGHIPAGRDHQNHESGKIAREKIGQFLSDYRKLHGREPKQHEIATAVGLSRASVINQMNRLYLFSGPYLRGVTSFETLPGLEWEANERVERDAISHMECVHILNTHVPNEKHRTWLYMHVFEDKTFNEIAKEAGTSGAYIGQALRKVLAQLKEVVVR